MPRVERRVLLHLLRPHEWRALLAFYRQSGYLARPKPGDTCFVAATPRGSIIGAARLCWTGSAAVLRGVRVRTDWHGRGIGTRLVLRALAAAWRRCDHLWVVPYTALVPFYARWGFRVVPPGQAPRFLQRRWARYRSAGYAVTLMVRACAHPPARVAWP